MKTLREIFSYPAAVVGLVLIILLLAVSIFAFISMPYNEAIRLWRGGEDVWYNVPKMVPPVWSNNFRSVKLPETIIISSDDESVEKVYSKSSDEIS